MKTNRVVYVQLFILLCTVPVHIDCIYFSNFAHLAFIRNSSDRVTKPKFLFTFNEIPIISKVLFCISVSSLLVSFSVIHCHCFAGLVSW